MVKTSHFSKEQQEKIANTPYKEVYGSQADAILEIARAGKKPRLEVTISAAKILAYLEENSRPIQGLEAAEQSHWLWEEAKMIAEDFPEKMIA